MALPSDKQIIDGIPAHTLEIVGPKVGDRACEITPSSMYFIIVGLFDKTRKVSLNQFDLIGIAPVIGHDLIDVCLMRRKTTDNFVDRHARPVNSIRPYAGGNAAKCSSLTFFSATLPPTICSAGMPSTESICCTSEGSMSLHPRASRPPLVSSAL